MAFPATICSTAAQQGARFTHQPDYHLGVFVDGLCLAAPCRYCHEQLTQHHGVWQRYIIEGRP